LTDKTGSCAIAPIARHVIFPVSCCRFQASAGEIQAWPCSSGIARIPQSCIIAR
jgi:hypothetical protein